jgi:hypothetical protein
MSADATRGFDGYQKTQVADTHYFGRLLLRACRQRRRRRAAEQRDEIAPFHSIELHPMPHEPGTSSG